MKFTYLYHSGFLVELEHHYLLFDYIRGELPIFDQNKALYVFVSHGHEDHYQSCIFDIVHSNMTYILSSDLYRKEYPFIKYLRPHEIATYDDVQVETLASTDLGVAFLVEVEGIVVYHAGDLHWWDWMQEDTEKESEAMKQMFQKEIQRIGRPIDLAFVPVDPRLQHAYAKGITYFMKHTRTRYIVAMHFGDDINVQQQLLHDKQSMTYRDKLIKITHPNEEFSINL